MDKTEEKPVYKTVEKSAEKCGKGRPTPRPARHYFASIRTARSSPTCPTTIQTIQGQNSFSKIPGGSEIKLRGSEIKLRGSEIKLRGSEEKTGATCFFLHTSPPYSARRRREGLTDIKTSTETERPPIWTDPKIPPPAPVACGVGRRDKRDCPAPASLRGCSPGLPTRDSVGLYSLAWRLGVTP